MKKLFALTLVLAVLASCQSKEPETIRVSSVSLSKDEIEMMVGERETLKVTVLPRNAEDRSVTWSSDNEAVVTVSDKGVLTAISPGRARVKVVTADQGKVAFCTVIVTKAGKAFTGEATHVSCRGAELAGTIELPDGQFQDLVFGMLYSVSSEVTYGSANQLTAASVDENYAFSVHTAVVEPGTAYYYRSFISYDGKVAYGDVKSFTTASQDSMIRTLDATDINTRDAVLNAFLDLTDCRYDTLEYGFELTPEGGKAYSVKADNLSGNGFSYRDASLAMGTTYSVAAYAILDGRKYKGEAKSLTTICPMPDAVDLGLSVKWATFNLGASTPEGDGAYFQWAGIRDVTGGSLGWNNCPYHDGDYYLNGWTKYIPSGMDIYWSGEGSPDNRLVLEPGDDAAHVCLKGSWRMATYAEWYELMNTSNCSWTRTTLQGVPGYKVQSLKQGFTDKWIFLPFAGTWAKQDQTVGYYWTSTLDSQYPNHGIHIILRDIFVRDSMNRYMGYSVRPVLP